MVISIVDSIVFSLYMTRSASCQQVEWIVATTPQVESALETTSEMYVAPMTFWLFADAAYTADSDYLYDSADLQWFKLTINECWSVLISANKC